MVKKKEKMEKKAEENILEKKEEEKVYSEKEEADMKERLKALGYFE